MQPASARCFLAAMFLPSAPSGIRAHAQHAILSTGRLGHFKISEFRRDRNAKYAIATRIPIHSYAKWYSFYLNESITTVLLHVIPHNCSEMHRNVAIPDYRSLVTQTSGMDICQLGYDICEFDSLRGLGIVIMGRLHFDNRDRFAIRMGSIGKVTKPWQFLEPWHGRWNEYEIFIASCTDNIFDLGNERWLLGTWLIMLGFMELGWPRVCRRPTSVLYVKWGKYYIWMS